MAVTQFNTNNIGSIQRNDIDTTTSGQAVITKVIAGDGISISSTGVNAGTGDVTISKSDSQTINLAPEFVNNNSPITPSDGITIYGNIKSGLRTLSTIDELGNVRVYAPHPAYEVVSSLEPQWAGAGFNSVGTIVPTNVGTAGTASSSIDLTNIRTASKRVKYTSAATAAARAGLIIGARPFARGNAANVGGFFFRVKFAVETTATGWTAFVGVCNTTSGFDLTTALPIANETNYIGIAKDSGDTNYQVMSNDGTSGTTTKIDTGITNSTSTKYAATIYCKPNDTIVYVSLEDLGTNTIFEQILNTTSHELPSSTTQLSFQVLMCNNTTASAVVMNIMQVWWAVPN